MFGRLGYDGQWRHNGLVSGAAAGKDNKIGHEIFTLTFSFNYVQIR